jgi:hypothetical protein
MRKMLVLVGLLLLAVGLFVACGEEQATGPDEALFKKVTYTCQPPLDTQLQEILDRIEDVYSSRNAIRGAKQIVDNIARKVCAIPPNYDATPVMAEGFYDHLLHELDDLQVELSEAIDLVELVFAFALGGTAPDFPDDAFHPTGGVGIVVPGVNDTVWTNNEEAAFIADPGSFDGDEPVTVVLRRLPDPTGFGSPIPGYQAYPLAFDISASRELAEEAEFWMCVDLDKLPPDVDFYDLVIGHDDGGDVGEILTPPLYEDFPGQVIECQNPSPPPPPTGLVITGLPGYLNLAGKLLEPVAERLLDVEPLNAMYFAGKGLGGRGGSLSPFAPVDIGGYEFELSCGVTPYGGISFPGGGCALTLAPGGPISAIALGLFAAGTTAPVTISPASGFEVSSTSGCTTGNGVETPCEVFMDRNRSVTAVLTPIPTTETYLLTLDGAGLGAGTVDVSYPDAGGTTTVTCDYPLTGGACVFEIPGNVEVQLTATAAASATFDDWGGACDGVPGDGTGVPGANCYLFMFEPKAVSAEFSDGLRFYTLDVSGSGDGAGTVEVTFPDAGAPATFTCTYNSTDGLVLDPTTLAPCQFNLAPATEVDLRAIPDASTDLGDWSGCSPDGSSCDLTMNSDRNPTIAFYPEPVLTIEIWGLGSVWTNAGMLCENLEPEAIERCYVPYPGSIDADMWITPSLSPDYTFSEPPWGGACAGESEDSCRVISAESVTVEVYFEPSV